MPGGGGDLTFWTSYDTEADWDFLTVEARTADGDDWTTLPEANGRTTQSTGDSCPAGWFELHPFLERYQTFNDTTPPTCSPTGDGGEWNAASGNSNGWQEWTINLNDYAGETVEISIAYVSDWATQGLGVFIDDVTLPDGTSTSFETGLEGWEVTGPPQGSGANANNFEVTTAGGFPVGASITHTGHDPDGLRVRGHRDAGGTHRGDGPRARSPARLSGGHGRRGRGPAAPPTWPYESAATSLWWRSSSGGAPCSTHSPPSRRLIDPARASSPIAVVTDGRWAPTRSASRWWLSGSGTTTPSVWTRPQRSARCQSVSSSRSSTRWWWEIASATAR